jgi:hypothetical protein
MDNAFAPALSADTNLKRFETIPELLFGGGQGKLEWAFSSYFDSLDLHRIIRVILIPVRSLTCSKLYGNCSRTL